MEDPDLSDGEIEQLLKKKKRLTTMKADTSNSSQ